MESINESLSFYNAIEKHKTLLSDGTGKLCISPYILSQINLVLNSLENNETKSPVDIAYSERIVLYDLLNILKSSCKIKLIQRNIATFCDRCDLSRCKALKQAEFCRINLSNVVGLDDDPCEIDCISCLRCSNVFDLFAYDVWKNLKCLTLSYCQLNKIEAECLTNITTVERLNLSFNSLTSIEGLELLTNLVSLDISYNFLDEIPNFKEESNSCLVELLVSNNNISNLSGLRDLVNLMYLDVSNNCIYEKEVLIDLYSLKHLKCLKSYNNPLCLRKHYRMYISHFLGTIEPPFQFLLDDVPLSEAELDFIGSSRGVIPKTPRPSQINSPKSPVTHNEFEIVQEVKGILKNSNRKTKKGREVVIVDSSGEPSTVAGSQKLRKTGVVICENVSLNNESVNDNRSSSSSKKTLLSENISSSDEPKVKVDESAVEVRRTVSKGNKGPKEPIFKETYYSGMHSSPESTETECRTVEVTVHASDSDFRLYTNNTNEIQSENPAMQLNESKTVDINDIRILESIDLILQYDKTEKDNNYLPSTDDLSNPSMANENVATALCENMTDDNINNNENLLNSKTFESIPDDKSSSDDSACEDELTDDENLWPVQKIVDSKPVNMFLVLLDTELRERSTVSGRTIANYPLAFVQSCTQVCEEPITVELIFSSLLKNKIVRTYIMEFADAQTLMNKMNVFLSSRPDEVEDQLTSFLCKSCNAFFSVFKTQARTLCTVCGSALVTEMEQPIVETVEDPLTSSSSQSSIVSSSHGASESKPSNNLTNMCSVSTVSSEPSGKSEMVSSLNTSTPQRYESDVEIISNPSESSIEVIDERGTPSRKRSSEERHVMIAPTLATLAEMSDSNLSSICETNKCASANDAIDETSNSANPISQQHVDTSVSKSVPDTALPTTDLAVNQLLTESSSSGSVVTSYEAAASVSNQPIAAVLEHNETDLDTSELDAYESCIEENDNSSEYISEADIAGDNTMKKPVDIYSYTNFTEVDHRIKAFLYQSVFSDDSEELTLLVRCHLWKTGGNDYAACFVLSNKKIYIFLHTSINNGLDASDWLKLQESLDLKCMKRVFPLVWHLGIGVQINKLNYLILLNNKMYSENLLQAFKGLSIKGCDIGSKPSSKIELNLQQVVLTSNYVRDVIDPTILLYTICSSIYILKDDEIQETMKLGGFVMTANEFYVLLGDFSWLAGSNDVPSIHFFQMLSNLIEISQKNSTVTLHFLDETEAEEVVWCLHCSNPSQTSLIIETLKGPWENVFSEPLQVTYK